MTSLQFLSWVLQESEANMSCTKHTVTHIMYLLSCSTWILLPSKHGGSLMRSSGIILSHSINIRQTEVGDTGIEAYSFALFVPLPHTIFTFSSPTNKLSPFFLFVHVLWPLFLPLKATFPNTVIHLYCVTYRNSLLIINNMQPSIQKFFYILN